MLADGNLATHSRGRYRLIPDGSYHDARSTTVGLHIFDTLTFVNVCRFAALVFLTRLMLAVASQISRALPKDRGPRAP
jgi:hypothetical protein